MPPMLKSVYDALLTSGTSPEVARKAAEQAALYDSRMTRLEAGVETMTHQLIVIKRMMAVSVSLMIALLLLTPFWLWQLMLRLP
jgi:hypothetical protein